MNRILTAWEMGLQRSKHICWLHGDWALIYDIWVKWARHTSGRLQMKFELPKFNCLTTMDADEGQKGPYDCWDRAPALRLESRQIILFRCHSMVMSRATLFVLEATKEWQELMLAGPKIYLLSPTSSNARYFAYIVSGIFPKLSIISVRMAFFSAPRVKVSCRKSRSNTWRSVQAAKETLP